MKREIANQQTSVEPGSGVAEDLVRRIQHPEFPANCSRVDEQISQSTVVFDNAAANLLEVLVDCQLLGVKSDTNVATVRGSALTERTKSSAKKQLERELTVGNIWVRNGPESYGLVSLRFSDRERAILFLDRNPDLARTLIMATQQEILVLVFIEGPKLASLDLADFRIQADGEVLLFDRSPGTMPWYFVQHEKPVTTDLRKINWDPEHEQALLPTIIQACHGNFSKETARGKRVPNHKAWAAYMWKTTQILFSHVDSQFYLPDGGPDKWALINRPELETLIETCIRKSPLPTSDKAVAVDPLHITKVIGPLKRLATGESPVFDKVIGDFIKDTLESVERSSGFKELSNVTVGELHALCRAYAIEHNRPVVPMTIFQRRIARLMSGPPLYVPKSQSIQRDGKNQNGFRGVRVKLHSQILAA